MKTFSLLSIRLDAETARTTSLTLDEDSRENIRRICQCFKLAYDVQAIRLALSYLSNSILILEKEIDDDNLE